MKSGDLKKLFYRLSLLSALGEFLDEPIYDAVLNIMMIDANEGEDWDNTWKIQSYGAILRAINNQGGDLGLLIKDYILNSDHQIIDEIIESGDLPKHIRDSLDYDLDTLQMLSRVTSKDIKDYLFKHDSNFDEKFIEELPVWCNTKVNLKPEFEKLIKNMATLGYGIFRENVMFKVKDGDIIPVKNADYQNLSDLYCYDRERTLVLKNTESLAKGRPASNVLLYGDAGTGKSTTVKACAAYYAKEGVRLIEFAKNQVSEIPGIADRLSKSPLKFIIFIDDLTFTENDDDYYALKGILEGNVSGKSPNILIYATSNRRHLIKESMAERRGDDVHLNDTLQETMSLSARFGLTVTFSKPDKDIYLSIVESMAKEHGIIDSKDKNYADKLKTLMDEAEVFAIRANGRSPRTAKQFIVQKYSN